MERQWSEWQRQVGDLWCECGGLTATVTHEHSPSAVGVIGIGLAWVALVSILAAVIAFVLVMRKLK